MRRVNEGQVEEKSKKNSREKITGGDVGWEKERDKMEYRSEE